MKVSIITVNYNDREGLRRTVESVIGQNSGCYEFIVIDGGSDDGSKDVIESFREKISYWVSEPDGGIYNAMNKGVAAATGEYCIFMNSGDVFHSSEVIACFCEAGACADIVCGNAIILENPARRKIAPEEITCETLFAGTLCHQAVLIRTSLLRDKQYDESLKIVADRKFFFEALILDNCSYQALDLDVVDYDINGFSAAHRFESEREWDGVLSDLLPARVYADYGKNHFGQLSGGSDYEKLFLEIGKRKYRRPVYRLAVCFLKAVSVFRGSAGFVNHYPSRLK